MTQNTKIEWADHTFNPWVGCQKVGPGCDHCYAEGWAKRSGLVQWGPGEDRRLTSAANWRQPLKWNAQAKASGSRPRVFCASLADVFDNAVRPEWRSALWDLIEQTSHLDWLLLTKRPGNIVGMLPVTWGPRGWHNVWLGCTVVNQAEADRDIPKLLAVPARVRFLSIEPLLGPLRLPWAHEDETLGIPDDAGNLHPMPAPFVQRVFNDTLGIPQINWIITGGESGPKARPMHPDWARSLRDQCQAAGVPFLFKQWGEYACTYDRDAQDPDWRHCAIVARRDQPGQWLNLAGGQGFHGERVVRMRKVGKSRAGRLLDGREWNELPEVHHAA